MEDLENGLDKINDLMYDGSNDELNGGFSMLAKEAFSAALRETGHTQADIAAKVNWSPQSLSGKLSRNSLRADEFLMLLDAAGVDILMVDRNTGEQIKTHITGVGKRVKAMVDGVIYDTDASDAIANSFYADGENEYTDGRAVELYIDKEGRYFFAEYFSLEGVKDRITPVTASDAANFIEKYSRK